MFEWLGTLGSSLKMQCLLTADVLTALVHGSIPFLVPVIFTYLCAGCCSKVVHGLALLYVVYTAIVFNLPTFFPVYQDNFNYSPIGVGVFIIIFVAWWVMDASKWFRGPEVVRRMEDEEYEEPAPTGTGKIFR